jgi:anthranilate synthase/aminodeoxychorismate synthase-like glutamine amidotransferase
MLFIIDNYDSFTYNLYHYFGELGYAANVYRNDEIAVDQIIKLKPKGIVISPGPCGPEKAGISIDLVKAVARSNLKIPLLGICLGHQAIGAAFGAKIIGAANIMHGKVDKIHYTKEHMIFKNLSTPFEATRYHSLCIDPTTLPKSLVAIAKSRDKTIMAIMHQELPIYGLQFHPESIKTTNGKQILNNFLSILE